MIKSRGGVICFLLVLSTLLLCSNSDSGRIPSVSVVIGNALLIRNGSNIPLVNRLKLMKGDTVSLSMNSKAKLSSGNGAGFYLNKGTKLSIGPLNKKNQTLVYLVQGDVHFISGDSRNETTPYIFITRAGRVMASDAQVYIKYKSKTNTLSVFTLSGSVSFYSVKGEEIMLPPCTRYLVEGAAPGLMLPPSELDIAELRNWVGSSLIDGALVNTGCIVKTPGGDNLPPEWKRIPGDICMAGELLVDTIEAYDPEGRHVYYQLLKGPEGMVIDAFSGEIHYRPLSSGEMDVRIRAMDTDSQFSDYEYTLIVSSGLAATLNVPRIVKPRQPFRISAAPLRTGAIRFEGLSYRFDLDGDGKFEYPHTGKFGSTSVVKDISINKEGERKITVEIMDARGHTARATRTVMVNAPPRAKLSITPSKGNTESVFELDAASSSDTQDSSRYLMVRFDTNGDGNWDLPSGGNFLREKRVYYTWKNPGKYRVILQVLDTHGLFDTDTAEVLIGRDLVVDIESRDSAHIGDSVVFYCKTGPNEYPIVKYEWSFDNDTVFETKSLSEKHVQIFQKAGLYTIRCSVEDSIGQTGQYWKKLVIVNTSCSVDAGGPYKAQINSPVRLEGSASDPDSRILAYYWDFNNDNIPDTTLKQNSSVTHVFRRSGKHTVVLTVETEDGQKVSDSAEVIVTNMPPVARAGEDVISKKGRKIRLEGKGEDPDGEIISYQWDFDADGVFDWSSEENGIVEHSFTEYSFAIFKVTDSDSAVAFDTLRVIICPEGMQLIEGGRFCVDIYEWPNKKYEMPVVDVSYEEAVETCAKEGKRICTAEEWQMACRNQNERSNYPYGKEYQVDRCNTIGNPTVKNKLSASGVFLHCAGASGIFDMSGNAAEWTRGAYVYGGSWQSGEDGSRCDSHVQLQKGRKYFYAGIRCCK
jgi:PKD repeat protein